MDTTCVGCTDYCTFLQLQALVYLSTTSPTTMRGHSSPSFCSQRCRHKHVARLNIDKGVPSHHRLWNRSLGQLEPLHVYKGSAEYFWNRNAPLLRSALCYAAKYSLYSEKVYLPSKEILSLKGIFRLCKSFLYTWIPSSANWILKSHKCLSVFLGGHDKWPFPNRILRYTREYK